MEQVRLLSRIFKELFINYGNNTSMHGVKYLTRKNASRTEKVIWASVTLCGILMSTGMFIVVSNKYWTKSTLTKYNTEYLPVQEVQFPALTLCSINQVSDRKMDSLLSRLNATADQLDHLKAAFRTFFTTTDFPFNVTVLRRLESLLIDNRLENVTRIMRAITWSCEELLQQCVWHWTPIDCRLLFFETFTSNGRCCTFNFTEARERIGTMYFGLTSGLSLVLNSPLQSRSLSDYVSGGAKVLVHNADQLAESGDTVILRRSAVHSLAIKTTVLDSSEYNVDISYRQCLFPHEKRLLHFPDYNLKNCLSECEIETYARLCDCVPYYYRFSNHTVCSPTGMICVRSINQDVLDYAANVCDCPEACSRVLHDQHSMTTLNRSICLNAYFRTSYIVPVQKITNTSVVKLLSSVGGVFSLFLGCSLISAFEIVYYCFIRFLILLKLEKHT